MKKIFIFAIICVTQAYLQIDNFGDSLTLGKTGRFLKSSKRKIIECYKEQKSQYEDIMANFVYELEKTAKENSKIIKSKNNYINRSIRNSLEKITGVMKKYPWNFFHLIIEKEYLKALELMEESKIELELGNAQFNMQIQSFIQESPKAGKEIEAKIKKIKDEAIKGAIDIANNILNCMVPGEMNLNEIGY